jgi:predicted MFS family arabinose efflux permease
MSVPAGKSQSEQSELSSVAQPVQAASLRILDPSVIRVFIIMFGTTTSFYLLLSVVPLYATAAGGASGIGAGSVTGALMCSTVAIELATPYLVARIGYRTVLAAALVLIGLPSLALGASTSMTAILVMCLVRGLGFGIIFVTGSSLVAWFVPAARHSEALGLLGIVVGIPAVLGLPLGVWFAVHVGYIPVFATGAIVPIVALLAIPGLPRREAALAPATAVFSRLRAHGQFAPATIFAVTSMAAGVVVTFLPLLVTQSAGNVAALALLVQAISMTLMRAWAGHQGARRGNAKMLIAAVVITSTGIFVLVVSSGTVAVLVAMALFGGGFGVAQNASLALMFERVSNVHYDAVSALWNAAYDTGLGLGAAGFGLIAATTGYRIALCLTAAAVLAALVPALRESAHDQIRRGSVASD